MCGINGILFFRNDGRGDDAISKMNNSIAHRGPDATGVYSDGRNFLGHTRLSIIDINEAANQPFYSTDKRHVLVFNGEIYNYQEIKSQIPDYKFVTNSDTEVVLAAYLKWGADCVSRFNGMFAFAILDSHTNKLEVIRDRIGIKPLYYYYNQEYLIFSSEIRSVLNSGLVERKLNRSILPEYLSYQTVMAPNTIIKDVYSLMPGCILKFNDDGISIRDYWTLWSFKDYTMDGRSKEIHLNQIKERFYSAIQRRSIADVPVGAFLSGGIDSAAVVGALSEVSSGKVNTFTVAFEESEFSEGDDAKLIAKRFNTQHTEMKLSAAELVKDIPGILSSMDHPSGDGINTYVVSKATKEQGISVALSGLGGDELFSGYPIFRQMDKIGAYKWMLSYPKGLRNAVGSIYDSFKKSVASDKIHEILKLDYFDLESAYPLGRKLFMDDEIKAVLKVPLIENNNKKIAHHSVSYDTPGFDFPFQSKVSMMEFQTYLTNVLLRDADQMSMAHALEIRVPFLDHQLVQYMLNVPDDLKLTKQPKQLLVESLGDLLPTDLLNKPKKGFVFPWVDWMKGDLKAFCTSKISDLKNRSFIDSKELERYWHRFLNGDKKVNWSKMWTLIVLENWLTENKIDE